MVFWRVYDGKENEEGTREKRFALQYFTVFNAEQLDGVALPAITPVVHTHPPIERCETLVEHMPQRPRIRHGGGRACYQPLADVVTMPAPHTFTSPERYYSTLFHELAHSTGHSSRLHRKTLTDLYPFGSTNYSKEELVAEMAATYLCGVCGIANATIDHSAAYIAGWLKALRHDPKCVITAAGQAQKAAEFIQHVPAHERNR